MTPFYQGKIDVFCALYAVLNALKVTHHIRTLQARDIFHDTLMGISQNPTALRAVFDQRTDYIGLVDAMLSVQGRKYHMNVEKPFEHSTATTAPSNHEVFNTIATWLEPNAHKDISSFKHVPERAVVFRFLRYLIAGAEPANKHWTTAYIMKDGQLDFFDCSLEEGAIYAVTKDSFVTSPNDISPDCLCCIEPHSIRFIEPRK